MDDKQKAKSNEGFWSELDESDEDFETMIGMGKKRSENQEIKSREVFEDKKEEFVKSQELKEENKFSEGFVEPTNDNQTQRDKLTEEKEASFVNLKESAEENTLSEEYGESQELTEDDQTPGVTLTEEIIELKLPPAINTEVNKSEESLESLRETTSFEISAKEKSSSVFSEFGEVDSESFETTTKGRSTFTNTVLSAEKMDFLWDDEDEEEIFVQPKIKQEKVAVSKQEKPTIKEEKLVDYKRLVKENIFAKDEVPIKEETISVPMPEPVNIVENEVNNMFFEKQEITPINNTVKDDDKVKVNEEVKIIPDEKVENNFTQENKTEKEVERQEEVKITPEKKVESISKPPVKMPFANAIPKKTSPKTIESSPSPKKFDISLQTPIVTSINRYTILYSTFKQKRRNQHGEYVDKETNIVSTFEYSLVPRISPTITLQNILQLNDEYREIIKVLSLKDCHVDNICKVLNVRDVVYTNNKYSEHYDSSDINSFIDICLVDKNLAIEFACKKKMWSFALVLSNNRPDIVKQFFENTMDSSMISLALSVVDKNENEEIVLDSDWKKYLKHILKIPFSKIHLKFIEKVRCSDEISLYTLLVCLHVLKLVNIGDVSEHYSKNFYMLQVLMYLDKHFTPVNNIGSFMYQYITVLYDFDKKASEEFYLENKRSFSPEIQSSLDQVFHVGGWGFGFKDVINFGISKILNVEEEKKPIVNSDSGNKTIGPMDINRSKIKSSLVNKTVVPQSYNKSLEVSKDSQDSTKRSEVPKVIKKEPPVVSEEGLSKTLPPSIEARKMSLAQGFKKVPVRQNYSLSNLMKAKKASNETYGAIEDIEKAVEGISLNENKSENDDNNVSQNQNEIVDSQNQNELVENEKQQNEDFEQKSKSLVINESRPLYSAQQHAKSFADIMDLEKPQKEFTTEDDTSLFLSKYNIDDNDGGLNKKKEEKKEEEQKSSFFSMFNIFKKNVYKVDLQASDDIKYDPVTKKWVSGSTPSAPQEVKKAVPKSIPLPSKTKPVAKSSVDVKNMSMYANKKSIGKAVIPGVSSIKKPSEKEDKM